MKGAPQTLVSKFKISYNLLLNLIDIGDTDLIDFSRKSMLTNEIDSELGDILARINQLQMVAYMEESPFQTRTPVEAVEQYYYLCDQKQSAVNKKRKDIEKQIQAIVEQHKHLEQDKIVLKNVIDSRRELSRLQLQFENTEKYIDNNVQAILQLLVEQGFVDETKTKLTHLGSIAGQLREMHCLVFAKLLPDIQVLGVKQLVALFSCFTSVNVMDEFKESVPNTNDHQIIRILKNVDEMFGFYMNKESRELQIDSGMDYTMHYDLINYVGHWCDATNEEECKLVLQRLNAEKLIFLGEFVKALLKVNNISAEFEKVAELTGNVEFLSKLKEISQKTMKFVVTNQSLYV